MTPEREKEIRDLVADRGDLASQQLIAEIDRLRAKEKEAVRDIKAAGQAWNEHLEKHNQLKNNLAAAVEALRDITQNVNNLSLEELNQEPYVLLVQKYKHDGLIAREALSKILG